MLRDVFQNSNIYKETLRIFNLQLLSIVENDNGKFYYSKSKACQNVWIKYSQKHQKSPTHANNNVQSCSRVEKTGLSHISTCQKYHYHYCKDLKSRARVKEAVTTINRNGQIQIGTLYLMKYVFFVFFILKTILIILISLVILYCVIVLHKPTQTFISRNTQDFIYPFMRTLRIITLPFIHLFPTFTNLYEESCLISNPFFATDNVDCWPCETVRHVPDLTGFSNFSAFYHQSGIPFVVKDAVKSTVELEDLKHIFRKNPGILSKLVDMNLNSIITKDELFHVERNVLNQDDLHIAWKVNRVTIARLFREYFPKPYFIPVATEVSVQHYLFLDNSKSAIHTLPMTEFANVFLTQASGSRRLVLIPTENCQQTCKVVSRVLHPKDVLFYNWLFWRPMSVPVESSSSQNNTSVTYIGSFY